jgi:hypothetical protein
MRTIISFLAITAVLASFFGANPVNAAVSVTGPVSLITDPTLVKASAGPIGLFEFSLNQTAGETLSSVSAVANQNATTTVSGGDLASLSLYKDNGDGSFNSVSDALVGSQTAITLGSTTMISAAASTTLNPTLW